MFVPSCQSQDYLVPPVMSSPPPANPEAGRLSGRLGGLGLGSLSTVTISLPQHPLCLWQSKSKSPTHPVALYITSKLNLNHSVSLCVCVGQGSLNCSPSDLLSASQIRCWSSGFQTSVQCCASVLSLRNVVHCPAPRPPTPKKT